MDISFINVLAKPIVDKKILRNVIAHNAGILNERDKKIALQQKGIRVVELEKENQFQIIDIIYFDSLLKDMELFFKELLRVTDKRFHEGVFIKKEKENIDFSDINDEPF